MPQRIVRVFSTAVPPAQLCRWRPAAASALRCAPPFGTPRPSLPLFVRRTGASVRSATQLRPETGVAAGGAFQVPQLPRVVCDQRTGRGRVAIRAITLGYPPPTQSPEQRPDVTLYGRGFLSTIFLVLPCARASQAMRLAPRRCSRASRMLASSLAPHGLALASSSWSRL